jgi:Sulfotransferase domain
MLMSPMQVTAGQRRGLTNRAAAAALRGASGVLGGTIHACVLGKGIVDYLKLRYVDFRPRPDDIFIASYPRSGTTWMQMIVYQMTSGGDMDFQHVSAVCPWFERSTYSGKDLESLPSPRIFKTHLRHYLLPRQPCRYIYVMRDGRDVAISLFHFYRSHFGFVGTFSEFFNMFLRGKVEGGSWFSHVAGWLAHRDDPNVLLLRYEDLARDLESSVDAIARFCGITLPAGGMPRILERSSFAFMKQHESRFDHTTEHLWERGVQQGAFLRTGKIGEGLKDLSRQQQELFDRLRSKKLGPCFDSA